MTAAEEIEMEKVTELISARTLNLVTAHWKEIREIADEPNDKGESGVIKFALSVELDFTGKTACGAVNINIPPRAIKDGSAFRVEDAEQVGLPLETF